MERLQRLVLKKDILPIESLAAPDQEEQLEKGKPSAYRDQGQQNVNQPLLVVDGRLSVVIKVHFLRRIISFLLFPRKRKQAKKIFLIRIEKKVDYELPLMHSKDVVKRTHQQRNDRVMVHRLPFVQTIVNF